VVIWTAFTLLVVIGMKYYTSVEMRKLERRLDTAKNGLQEVKEKLQIAEDKQRSVETEEQIYQARLKFMKEIIQDIQFRQTSNQQDEQVLVPGSMSPPTF